MAEWANHNRDVAASLQSLMDAYEVGGGSNQFNMVSLRGSFAQIIPYEHPNFNRFFSSFATEAVAKDFRANRFVYPIGGMPPDPALPIQDTVPYIYPIQFFTDYNQEENQRRGDGEENRPPGPDMPEGDPRREGERGGAEGSQRDEAPRAGEERRQRKEKRPADVISSEDESGSDNNSSDTPHVFSFIKSAKIDDQPLSAEARAITKLVLEYKTKDLNAAVLAFCWRSGKHDDFPDALVRDLLQYKFIDLEKINAGPSACKSDPYSKKDNDPASKIKPKPFKEATEWRDVVSLLVETLGITFVR